MPPKVLLIGWDAADWKIITPLLDAGKMPQLARLVDEGVMGNLATLHPPLSPMLWTSIATGKRPFKHGINGFVEPNPHGGGVRPISGASRKTRAIWNILHLQGLSSNVVGWWPSHPAEPIRGAMVSNHFAKAEAPIDKPWPMRQGAVHPPRLIEPLKRLRVHPQEVTAAQVQAFVPELAKIDQHKDRRPMALAKILADTASVHAAATALVQLEKWDFMAVYYDGIDHFCHAFMNYHPPRMPDVKSEDFALYQHVVEGAYRLHDAMLGVLLGLAGQDVSVVLLSDHGFHGDHLRPTNIPREPAAPAMQHRRHGVLVMHGPGIKQDERIYGANLLDIAPTILAMYGLPIGLDMDGKALVNVFQSPPAIATIESWDAQEGEDGSLSSDLVEDPVATQEALNQLVALGYIDKPDEDASKAADKCVNELRYNMAASYVDASRHAEAASLLEELTAKNPDEHRYGILLTQCYQALGRLEEAKKALEESVARKLKNAAIAAQKLQAWRAEHPEPDPDKLTPQQRQEVMQLSAEASCNLFAVEFFRACQFLAEGDAQAALVYLENAERASPNTPSVQVKKGEAFLALKCWAQAEECFREALALEEENVSAQLGLCSALLGQRQNSDAVASALTALGLLFYNPWAHYLLGVALHRTGQLARAIEALRMCLAQNANFFLAHERLAFIYEKRLGNPQAAKEHHLLAQQARRTAKELRSGPLPAPSTPARSPRTSDQDVLEAGQDYAPPIDSTSLSETILIVSGLPRTGTSMMMQMLKAGGIAPLVDDHRPADLDNQQGYFEFAPAKKLRKDASWLAQAKGKVVKVVAHLLASLPRDKGYAYRGIFMERDLHEVLASQRDMLAAQHKRGADLTDDALRQVYTSQLRQIKRLLAVSKFPVLYVSHHECLEKPAAAAARVNAFLGGGLNEQAMAEAVRPQLYRHNARMGDAAYRQA